MCVPTLQSTAFAQKGKQFGGQKQASGKGMKGGKGSGQNGRGGDAKNGKDSPAAHLPTGFQQLSKDEVKLLESLCGRVLEHIVGSQSRSKTSLLSIADYFGSMEKPKDMNVAAEGDAQPEPPISETDIGLYVLSRLDSEQRGQLGKLVTGQRTEIAEYEQLREKVLTMLQSLSQEKPPQRGFEQSLADAAKAVGEKEIGIATAQARAFADIAKSLTQEQKQFLLLVRSSPAAISTNNESIAEVRAALVKIDTRDQEAIAILAYKAACYCTGTAAQNAASRTGRSSGLFGGKSADGKEGQMTGTFLNTLNPTQQRQLYQLLGSQVRTLRTQMSRRTQVIFALDAIKTGEPAVERKLQQVGGQFAETEMQAAVTEAKALQIIKDSLTA
ncbi:MAG: hypothetical protein KDB00_06100, partial [Planctomycetales bacterium]|nr:hypothetical protein [Planctomycetales bacterium]